MNFLRIVLTISIIAASASRLPGQAVDAPEPGWQKAEKALDVFQGLLNVASARAAQKVQENAAKQQEKTAKSIVLRKFQLDLTNAYRSGQRALDQRQYEQAVTAFDRVIEGKEERADGAMYWKAYALNKLGRRDPALAALADLEKQFPQSRWLNDARALAVEVRAAAGQGVSPESQVDEDIKLLAISSLMNQDPDRALPLLEKLLNDAKNPPALKSRALFVLAQSKVPRAGEIVSQYAKGGSNPDLQLQAIEYLGTFRRNEAEMLTELYAGTSDPAVKRAILRAMSRQQTAAKQLVDIARKENDPALKREAVRQLANMKSKEAADYLIELINQ
jgi:HEAT repeat protein